jgi:hypothetical protein
MNRIQKYQDSIDKFLKTRIYLLYLDNNDCNIITNSIKKNDFFVTIFLLTLTNNINKKNKIHQHGYYIGSSMELAFLLQRSVEKHKLFDLNNENYIKITNLINILLSHNLELASGVLSREKLMKNYSSVFKLVNNQIISIISNKHNYNIQNAKTSDLVNYRFENIKEIKNMLNKNNFLNEEDIIKYIEKKYCPILEMAALLTWNLAGGQENQIKYIEKLGHYFAFLIKLYYDLGEFETDIKNDIKYNDFYGNIIINLGIQKSFEYFMIYKKKFIELSIKMGLFSNTIKEVLDIIETKLDIFIENTIPFLEEI